MNEPPTVRTALKWGTERLRDHSVDSPRMSCEVLLSHCLHVPRLDLLLQRDRTLSWQTWEQFAAYVEKRLQRRPVEYITGKARFYSRSFEIDERAMIPRPETETLVQRVLARVSESEDKEGTVTICDLGTGSGVIPITLCLERSDVEGVGLDCSADALELARANAERHGVRDRLRFLEGDFLAPEGRETLERCSPFDVIVSNPPYVDADEMASLQPEVKDHEPTLALKAPCARTDLYRQLCELADDLRCSGGIFAMELSEFNRPEPDTLGANTDFDEMKIRKDHRGVKRILIAS